MKSKISLVIILVFAAAVIGTLIYFKGDAGVAALWNLSKEGQWLLPLVIVASLIDSVNPCAFSVLLLTIAFLFSIGRLRSGILKIGGMYIFGVFAVYVLIGLGIVNVLHLFNTPHFMALLGAVLLIALGLVNVINEFFPAFPIKLKIPSAAHHKMAEYMAKASMPTAFLLGALVGLCEFPCTGGPYLLVLGLLHDNATYVKGALYLLLYNLVFVLPLVIILSLSSSSAVLDKVKDWQTREKGRMRLWGGIAMIALGAIILLI